MTEETPYERLNRLMNERRLQLRLRWFEIAQRAGITVTTLGALRKGQNEPTDDTKWGIETALEWVHGSFDQVVAGRDPRAARDAQAEADELVSTDPDHAREFLRQLMMRLEPGWLPDERPDADVADQGRADTA